MRVLTSYRIGDMLYLVEHTGYTDDAEPLLCGYLRTVDAVTGHEVCCIGLCWDESRFLIFAEGTCASLNNDQRAVLIEAGFTLTE